MIPRKDKELDRKELDQVERKDLFIIFQYSFRFKPSISKKSIATLPRTLI